MPTWTRPTRVMEELGLTRGEMLKRELTRDTTPGLEVDPGAG
jgi:hypothetical protein